MGDFILISGDGGIRTRVPRRTNAFRVRLITTTLIRLQALRIMHRSVFYYTFLMVCSQPDYLAVVMVLMYNY